MNRVGLVLAALLVLSGCARELSVLKGQEQVINGSLEGGPWLVEDINGGGVIDNARLELTFAKDKVTGFSGCNRVFGGWQQTGTTIKLGPLAGTRMMCPPALMDTEGKLLATLEAVTSVRFDATGAAFLGAADGRIVKLRKAAP